MILLKKIDALQKLLQSLRNQNKKIGFVPTMGALHKGHLSLIEAGKKKADVTVCSIFVNPAQFNDADDFKKYPRTIEQDIRFLEQQKTDVLFLPSVEEVFPVDLHQNIQFNLGELENILEGFYRPGHFLGVGKVVYRLLEIVQPDMLLLGQKDFQQCMVIKKLADDFYPSVKIQICSTTREASGLAMSSRNMRLSEAARDKAATLFKALSFIKDNIYSNAQTLSSLKEAAAAMLLENGFDKIDYIAICDADTLQPLNEISHSQQAVVLAAVFIEGVRLIDNLLLD